MILEKAINTIPESDKNLEQITIKRNPDNFSFNSDIYFSMLLYSVFSLSSCGNSDKFYFEKAAETNIDGRRVEVSFNNDLTQMEFVFDYKLVQTGVKTEKWFLKKYYIPIYDTLAPKQKILMVGPGVQVDDNEIFVDVRKYFAAEFAEKKGKKYSDNSHIVHRAELKKTEELARQAYRKMNVEGKFQHIASVLGPPQRYNQRR
jgi:protoheme ferro-lyase